jgi:hypothetical protein
MPLYTPSTLYPSYTSESHTVSLVLSTQRVSHESSSESRSDEGEDEDWSVYSTFLILQEMKLEFGGQLSICFARTLADDQLSEYDPPSPTLSTPERTELPQHVQSSEMARYVYLSSEAKKDC